MYIKEKSLVKFRKYKLQIKYRFMTQPIVSVIIPTYKRNTNLERAINSVLNQSIDNLEIIIVDDNQPKSKYRKLNEKLT
ncbi:MAG: glycosyltransferase [Candidatus Lokiarchaeota archaeon]